MKKKNLKNLRLNKNTVSNFNSEELTGGRCTPTNSCQPFYCLVDACETHEFPECGDPVPTLLTCGVIGCFPH